jgi:hypothetical protein
MVIQRSQQPNIMPSSIATTPTAATPTCASSDTPEVDYYVLDDKMLASLDAVLSNVKVYVGELARQRVKRWATINMFEQMIDGDYNHTSAKLEPAFQLDHIQGQWQVTFRSTKKPMQLLISRL